MECVRTLLHDGVQPDTKNIRSWTPLSVAARNGHKGIVELLVQMDNVNINSLSEDGRSPIFLAAGNGHEDIVTLLIDAGADPRLTCQDGDTALSIAERYGNKGVVQILERSGVKGG